MQQTTSITQFDGIQQVKERLTKILLKVNGLTISPQELMDILDQRCSPKKFDRGIFKQILANQWLYNDQKQIIVNNFIEQYTDYKDSLDFAIRLSIIQDKQIPQSLSSQPKTDESNCGVVLLFKTIAITEEKQEITNECTIVIYYNEKQVAQTTPQSFKNKQLIINEQFSIQFDDNNQLVTIKIQRGKDTLGSVLLDCSKYSRTEAQDINQQFQINKYNAISNSYFVSGILKFFTVIPNYIFYYQQFEPFKQVDSISRTDLQAKQLQQQIQQQSDQLNAIMLPLLKPIEVSSPPKPEPQPQAQPQAQVEESKSSYLPYVYQEPPSYNQSYSQIPVNQRRITQYPKENWAQTDKKILVQDVSIYQEEQPKLDYDNFLDVGESEVQLIDQIDKKLNLSERANSIIFLTFTSIVFFTSLFINFVRIQFDVIINFII